MSTTRLLLFVALRQLADKKTLHAIAVAGVALGVLSLVTLSAVMQGFQVKFKNEISKVSPHVTVHDRRLGADQSLASVWLGGASAAEILGERPADKVTRIERPRDLVMLFESMPDVVAACANLRGQAIVTLGPQSTGIDMHGVRPADQDRCTPLAQYVTEGSWAKLDAQRDAIAIGSGVAIKIGAKLGDRVRLGAPGGRTESLEVVAILDIGIPAVDNSRVYVNLTTSQSVLRRPNVVGQLELRLSRPLESVAFARRAEAITGYESEGWQEANANFLQLFDLQNMIVNIVIGAVLTLGGFGILSTQIMIVLQRTKDIAILRSIGFRRRDILFTVLLQGAIVALLGGAIGDLTAWRLIEWIATLKIKSDGLIKSATFLVHKDPAYYVYGACFALIVGIVASLLPSLRAARIQPVAVLRGLVG